MTSVTMPQLGESVTEGTITRWLKQVGDAIAKYEPLVEVMTDKVNSEIPSPEAGTLARIAVAEGQTVKIGTEIGVIEPAATQAEPQRAPATGSPGAESGIAGQPGSTGEAGESDAGSETGPRRTSPLVRRLAREFGIDLALVSGSGTGGRVTKEDMLAYIGARRAAPVDQTRPGATDSVAAGGVTAVTPPAETSASTQPTRPAPEITAEVSQTPPPWERPAPVPAGASSGAEVSGATSGDRMGATDAPYADDDEEALPVSPIRRAIADHMVRSLATAPHTWTYVEVNCSGLVAARAAARVAFRNREGVDLTYVPFVCKALATTLREHPTLNSTWRDGRVVLKKRIHLGVAVALEDGLIVPVVRDADERTVAGLAKELARLVARAREGRLSRDEVQGGTFTLNNTGSLGSVLSMPIINQPQAAILTMELMQKRVVVTKDDAIAVRPMVNLCLSFDHRVCDGLQVGHFMQALRQRIEALSQATSIY